MEDILMSKKKKNDFGENIRTIRKHYGVNMTEMATKLGIVKSNLSRYERNLIKPTVPFVELLLKHYKINLNWLFGAEENMLLAPKEKVNSQSSKSKKSSSLRESTDVPAMSFTSFGVPVFIDPIENASSDKHLYPIAGSISAGDPLPIPTSYDDDFVAFPFLKLSSDSGNYLVFKVNGLSMNPDIHHDDFVFILKNDNWVNLNGKIVAVNIGGDMTLKKLHVDHSRKEVVFKPLNKNFDDITVSFQMLESTTLVGELKAIRRVYNK